MIQLSGFRPYEEIDIQFTGLRPGEKLYEELLASAENSIPTHHPKITKAKVRDYPFVEITERLDKLEAALDVESDTSLVRRMKEIVPEFISKNSVFDQIDKKEGDHSSTNDIQTPESIKLI